MRVATDTNILLRLVEPGHTQHSVVLNAVVNLRMSGHALCVFPQMLYEFWAVATVTALDPYAVAAGTRP